MPTVVPSRPPVPVPLPGRAGVRRGERGAVTAETMTVLPVLVALALGLAWLLSLGAAQVRVIDAAREVARAAARHEPQASAVALGRRVAPAGARFAVQGGDGTVVVDVVAPVNGLGGLLGFLPEVPVTAHAVAAEEPS